MGGFLLAVCKRKAKIPAGEFSCSFTSKSLVEMKPEGGTQCTKIVEIRAAPVKEGLDTPDPPSSACYLLASLL